MQNISDLVQEKHFQMGLNGEDREFNGKLAISWKR